jgi:NitT/TauT family transport system ATP-binding protein/nitrate/nitrite transport system substrate-binding protein
MTAPVRLGLLRLTDSAPAVLAQASGLFAAEGLDVALHVEPSWANVADKLAFGLLDAAIMLPPLALAAVAGLRGSHAKLIVPMGISLGGNAVVLGGPAAAALPGDFADARAAGHAFATWLRSQSQPPRFAVVHVFSTHNLLLRHWLAEAGIDSDRHLEIVVVPPGQVVNELAAGRIAGFCAGAPWGEAAADRGAGRVLLGSSAIRPDHAEKCLTMVASWAASRPETAAALMRALHRAQSLCDDAARAPALAALLADRLSLPETATRAALAGGSGIEKIRFAGATAIARADALWFFAEMRRWGWLEPATDVATLATQVYRPDLLPTMAIG